MKAVVDRFEGDSAVLLIEGLEEPVNFPRQQLPEGIGEGDHLKVVIKDGQIVSVEVDPDATRQARERIQQKVDRLRRGDHLKRDD